MNIKFSLKLNAEVLLAVTIMYLAMYEFLPFLKTIYRPILTLGRIGAIAVFYLYVLFTSLKTFCRFMAFFIIAFVVNLLAYYHCWCNYETIGNYMIDAMMCWVYMEIGIFILRYGSFDLKRSIGNGILLMVCIASITSVISLRSVPTAVRELGNGSMHIKGLEQMLYRRNTLTWGGLNGVTFLLPYVILRIKQDKSPFHLICLVLMEYCIIRSQITTAIIISVVFLATLFINKLTTKKLIAIVIIAVILSSILMSVIQFLVGYLYEIVSKTDNAVLTLRLSQISKLVSNHEMTGTISGRYDLYLISLKSFLDNPILGIKLRDSPVFTEIGMHSQLFDLLGAVGIVGFMPLLLIFCALVHEMNQILKEDMLNGYFILAILMLVLLMTINPTWYAQSVYLSSFLGAVLCIPGSKEMVLVRELDMLAR